MEGGDALLIAGHGPADEVDDPRLPLVTQLGEAVLASAAAWRVRRLAGGGPDRDAPSRGNVRRELDAMLGREASARIVVIAAPLTRTLEGLGVLCGRGDSAFREDDSVSLEWFAKRLRASAVPTAFVIAAPATDLDLRACLDALGTGGNEHVIAIAAGDQLAILREVKDGLWGDAIDLGTGSITPSSLGSFLDRRIAGAAIQPSASTATLLAPRGLVRADLAEHASHRPAESDELIDAMLPGQFKILSELGQGSVGIVYRARQQVFDREVAIKVVRPGVEAIQQFALEIRAVSRLDHRNVVRAWHADTTRDGRMFVAMELLAGPTLHDVIDRGALSPEVALDYTMQLLDGLAAAHAEGIIHADVKPANAILVDGERVVLLDFGFACLRADNPVSIGGTPAFMAPEQWSGEHIGPSVDVYATALVALTLVQGYDALQPARRAGAIAAFDDERVRKALTRALDDDPTKRFASAAEMLAALSGEPSTVPLPVHPPFRIAAPFSEQERDNFHGRAHEVERLLEHVLFHRAVVYVAPSGTGKTSLLLAGLIPRLRDLDVEVAYVPCRAGGTEIAGVIAKRLATPTTKKLVVVIDQVETALSRDDAHAVFEDLGMPAWPLDTEISIVWSVREEYLARLLDRVRKIEPGVPIVRLPPLTPAVAAQIVRLTFERRGATVTDEAVERLIADLVEAAARLSLEHGWGDAPAVYPPHLQLAGAVLDLERDGGPVDLALYEDAGGFQTILGEHLHHVIEDELDVPRRAIARDILLALLSRSRSQVACEERDLLARVGNGRSTEHVTGVLQFLREHGLLVMHRPAGEPVWDLAHDSLAVQIEAWLTKSDAARRRAMDLMRYHLQRSTAEVPSRLGVAELREVRDHLEARDREILDEEWRERLGARPATRLLAASKRAIIFRRVSLAVFGVMAILIAGAFAFRWREGQAELRLRDRDIGKTELVLKAFDWDPGSLSAKDATAADFQWELMRPSPDDPDLPGTPFPEQDFSSEPRVPPSGAVRADTITARGGPAVLTIARRDRDGVPCSPVIVPIRQLPGYDHTSTLSLSIPTCEASAAGMLAVAAGPFYAEGVGQPPSPMLQRSKSVEHEVVLPAYALDRTEVPNALLKAMEKAFAASGRELPVYVTSFELGNAGNSGHPVASLPWRDAAVVCRLLGKRLPTSLEWQKAMRGGTTLRAGERNEFPHRNMPWGHELAADRTNIRRTKKESSTTGNAAPRPVGSYPDDVGPYGHLDLAGNVSEWTSSKRPDGARIIRGGNWDDTMPEDLPDSNAIENPRPPLLSAYTIGVRCASDLAAGQLREDVLSQGAPGRQVEIHGAVSPRSQAQ